jgi:hypothetical protein
VLGRVVDNIQRTPESYENIQRTPVAAGLLRAVLAAAAKPADARTALDREQLCNVLRRMQCAPKSCLCEILCR